MSDLGVVDQIRVPARILDVGRRFRALPWVAQLFIALALLDAFLQAFAILLTGAGFGDGVVAVVANVVLGFGPRGAQILLPAVLVIRRPTAARDTPWIHRGAIFLALMTLLGGSVRDLLLGLAPGAAPDSPYAVATLESLLFAAAYAVMALGIAVVNPRTVRPVVAGLANLAALGIIAGGIADEVAILARDQRFALDAGFEPFSLSLLDGVQWLAIAYLLRSVIQGLDDPGRAEVATRVGAVAALLWMVGAFSTLVIGAIGVLTGATFPGSDLAAGFALLDEIAPLVLVVAFALGLADPTRPLAREWAATSDGA
ncbi:MAG TPA: hypothetical protein VKR30_01695 [Candidatus Limnocylindrales bacterium]|nr:hypothetical protein [Candidatus Limnocylindrales bacterium]